MHLDLGTTFSFLPANIQNGYTFGNNYYLFVYRNCHKGGNTWAFRSQRFTRIKVRYRDSVYIVVRKLIVFNIYSEIQNQVTDFQFLCRADPPSLNDSSMVDVSTRPLHNRVNKNPSLEKPAPQPHPWLPPQNADLPVGTDFLIIYRRQIKSGLHSPV